MIRLTKDKNRDPGLSTTDFTTGAMLQMTQVVSLDDRIVDHSLAPGETATGWGCFAYSDRHADGKTIISTSVTIRDFLWHSTTQVHLMKDYRPQDNLPSTNSYRLGPAPVSGKYRYIQYADSK